MNNIDNLVAQHVMLWTREVDRYNGPYYWKHDGKSPCYVDVWKPTTNLSDLMAMRQRIAEKGLADAFMRELRYLINQANDYTTDFMWQILNAKPEIQCVAALAAVGVTLAGYKTLSSQIHLEVNKP